MSKVNEDNEKMAKENEDRIFRKYVGFYWQKKANEKSVSTKNKSRNNRLREKEERLEELDKENEVKRKNIIKKLQNMEKKKNEYEKEKNEKIMKDKQVRQEKMEKCRTNLDALLTEEYERRQEILDYQNEMLGRCLTKEKNELNTSKMRGEKSVMNQMIIERNMGTFNKIVNELKEKNIMSLTEEQRFGMYKELKKEEEKKRKEMEEELMLNKMGNK